MTYTAGGDFFAQRFQLKQKGFGGMSAVEQKVRGFILENFMFSDDETALNSGESLLDKGVIDSTGVMELVAFLEDEYHIQVGDEELVPENLDSVNNIVAFVGGKLAGA